jgi:hypothetical protein
MTGTSMTHVPYKGRQFAIPDLVGGSIQLMFDNMPSALPMAKEGKIRALAQTTAKRSPAAPDVPSYTSLLPAIVSTILPRLVKLGPGIGTGLFAGVKHLPTVLNMFVLAAAGGFLGGVDRDLLLGIRSGSHLIGLGIPVRDQFPAEPVICKTRRRHTFHDLP